MKYELEYETEIETKLTDAQKEKIANEAGSWLRVYYDQGLDSYYIDDFEFLSLATSYEEHKPSGAKVMHYVLGSDSLEGDLKRYIVNIPGANIIRISKETLKMLEKYFRDRIDYVYINLVENKKDNYANQIQEFKDYVGIKNLEDYRKYFIDSENSIHQFTDEGLNNMNELNNSSFDDNNMKL